MPRPRLGRVLRAVELGEAEIVGIVRLPFDLVDDPSTEALMIAGPDFR